LALLATSPPSLSASPSSVSQERFKAPDQAFQKRRNHDQARWALEQYRKLFQETPHDPEAAWRVGMAAYYNGSRVAARQVEKKILSAEGREAGVAGARLDPKCAPCDMWRAISMALYGDTVGVYKTIFTLGETQKQLKLSI